MARTNGVSFGSIMRSYLGLAGAIIVLLTGVTQAQTIYTWTGNASSGSWGNKTNWGGSGYPQLGTDIAIFSNATTQLPQFTSVTTFGMLEVFGSTNWTWSGSSAVTNNQVFLYSSSSTNASVFSAPPMSGTGGVTVTSGYLTMGSSDTYSGPVLVQGGILDASSGAVRPSGSGPCGSSSADIIVGGSSNNAELRLGASAASRNITITNLINGVAGAGQPSLHFAGTMAYTGVNTLGTTVVYNVDSGITETMSGLIQGPFGFIKTGLGTLTFTTNQNTSTQSTYTNNIFTGPTVVSQGILQIPDKATVSTNGGCLGVPGPNGVLTLGVPTTPTNSPATLSFAGTGTMNIPITVLGPAKITSPGNGGAATFNLPITLSNNLTVSENAAGVGDNFNAPITMMGTGLPSLTFSTFKNYYNITNQPNHTGGTILTSSSTLQWQYPGVSGDNKLVHFGTAAGGGAGTITLDNGTFQFYPTNTGAIYTNDNVIVVTTNNGTLEWGFTGNASNYFTGPISLGGPLTVGDIGSGVGYGYYQGTVTLNQSIGWREALYVVQTHYTACYLSGNVVDGSGPSGNSLSLRTSASPSPVITGTGNTYAYGTIVDANESAIFNVQAANGTSTLGTGNQWLLEGSRLRWNQSGTPLAGGAFVGLYGNQTALGVLALGASSLPVPPFTSDSYGVLAIDTTGYTAAINQANLGGGKMYLGSVSGGTYAPTAGSLLPCSDNIYRLGGGAGTLTISNNVFGGPANASLQIGAPASFSTVMANTAEGGSTKPDNGSGTVILQSSGTFSGITVSASCTLQGTAQTSGSPFGNSTGPVTLNGGSILLSGAATSATNTVGAMTVNGFGSVEVSQGNKPTNTLVFASLPVQSTNAPWCITFNGSAVGTLGSRERVIISTNAPVPTNGMVAPYLMQPTLAAGVAHFLTYNTNVDAAGVIGFTNADASASYVTVTNGSTGPNNLDSLPATAIVNVTAGITNNNADTIYALNMSGGSINNGGSASLTIGSGGIICGNGGNIGYFINEPVSFGSAPGFIFAQWGGLTFSNSLSGVNGLTKAGAANVNLYGNNTTLAGTIAVVEGTMIVTNLNGLGPASNPIYLAGGGALGINKPAGATSQTLNNPITLGMPGGAIYGGNTTGYSNILGGTITGPGGLMLVGSTGSGSGSSYVTISNQNNTYSGGTLFLGLYTTAVVVSNATCGVGDVTVASALVHGLYFYGDSAVGGGDIFGNNTTQRQARLSLEGGAQVYFLSANPSVGSLSGSGNVYLNNTTLTLGGDNTSTIFDGFLYQNGSTTGQIYKTGSGRFMFKGASQLAGTNTVANGTLNVDGFIGGAVVVNNGATLSGAGTVVGAVTLNSGATLIPGSTQTNSGTAGRATSLSAGSLALASGSTIMITISNATTYTQINAGGGPVTLGGSTLQVTMLPGYTPGPTDSFAIITNATSIGGAFAGTQNPTSRISLGNGYTATITYTSTAVTLSNLSRGASGSTLLFW